MECQIYGKRISYLINVIYKATKRSISNILEDFVHCLGSRLRGMRKRRHWRIELVHAWQWNTPRSCGCNDFEAGGKFRKNLPVRGKLVIPREKSPPAVSIILGTILRDSFAGAKQSLQDGLNGMTKVRD